MKKQTSCGASCEGGWCGHERSQCFGASSRAWRAYHLVRRGKKQIMTEERGKKKKREEKKIIRYNNKTPITIPSKNKS